jgi:hypothetical protein
VPGTRVEGEVGDQVLPQAPALDIGEWNHICDPGYFGIEGKEIGWSTLKLR